MLSSIQAREDTKAAAASQDNAAAAAKPAIDKQSIMDVPSSPTESLTTSVSASLGSSDTSTQSPTKPSQSTVTPSQSSSQLPSEAEDTHMLPHVNITQTRQLSIEEAFARWARRTLYENQMEWEEWYASRGRRADFPPVPNEDSD